jgi:putative transposase
MPRASRLVVPELAHHVVQRGNRQQALFGTDDDRRAYLNILAAALDRAKTRCLAWCLMSNHVHLMLVPADIDGLRAPLASTHTAYAQRINRAQTLSGHLFQGRFASYPMDDAHMMVAARYIENNPVAAGLVTCAEDWPWSSARAHIARRSEGLTDVTALGQHVRNWRAMLVSGLEASDVNDAVESALKTGRLLGTEGAETGARKRGRPKKPRMGTVPIF